MSALRNTKGQLHSPSPPLPQLHEDVGGRLHHYCDKNNNETNAPKREKETERGLISTTSTNDKQAKTEFEHDPEQPHKEHHQWKW